MALLELRDLHSYYGQIEAIHGINMDIEEGKITVIIGSNGAGKSTIINSISGLVKRNDGVFYNGAPLTKKAYNVNKEKIIQVPEGRRVLAGMSVEENLRVGAYHNKDAKSIEELMEKQYELFPRLGERRKQDAGTLSGGEQQMLVVCRGLMAQPKILMLDEPSMGLAPNIVEEVFATIKKIRESGVTVLLVEQNARKSLAICDYAYVVENGNIVNQNVGEVLLNDSSINEAYLGGRK